MYQMAMLPARSSFFPIVTSNYHRTRTLIIIPSCSTSASGFAAKRGALIVFEGIDCSGKSTQVKLLANHLQKTGIEMHQGSSPDRTTPIGKNINDYLQNKSSCDDTVIHLLFTANRFEKRSEILRLLWAGTTVILDRYSYSGVAYTAAKGMPHLSPNYCKAVEVGLPAADLVVYMAIAPEESAARGGFGQERYEKLDFQRKVVQQFEALRDDTWLTIDAREPVEAIHKQVVEAAQAAVDKAGRGASLLRLWDCQPLLL